MRYGSTLCWRRSKSVIGWLPLSLYSTINIIVGNRNRTTHATESNDESSRSHAICQIALRAGPQETLLGRFSLIDLAGSERGADTKSHNRQRRMEGRQVALHVRWVIHKSTRDVTIIYIIYTIYIIYMNWFLQVPRSTRAYSL